MKGVPIHEALYSTINEYEEARSSAMVPTKALSYVSEVYKGIKTSLEKTEQEPTQVIYCDQPEGASFKNKFIAKIYFLQSNSHFMKVSTIHFVKGYSIDLSGPGTVCLCRHPVHLSYHSHAIEAGCNEILDGCFPDNGPIVNNAILAVATTYKQEDTPTLQFIQLRAAGHIYILDVSDEPSCYAYLSCLRRSRNLQSVVMYFPHSELFSPTKRLSRWDARYTS
jgi:hypothetical protein